MVHGLGLSALVVSAIAAIAPASAAEPAPRWEVGEICATSKLGAQCPRIESQNRSSVLLRWEAIPVDDRRACKAEVTESGTLSYKQLMNCLEERQLKALDDGPQSGKLPQNAS